MRNSRANLRDYGRMINVGPLERIASTLFGASLLSAGLARRRLRGLIFALGGLGLIRRGVSGHCGLYDLLWVTTWDRAGRTLPRDELRRAVPGEKGARHTDRMREEIDVGRFEG